MSSRGHQLELARFVSTQAIHSLHLQLERSEREEADDQRWGGAGFRQEADLGYFLIALRRLRRIATWIQEMTDDSALAETLGSFDTSLRDVKRMRDVDEHIEEYLAGRGRDESIPLAGLGVTIRRGCTLEWAGFRLDLDHAIQEAEALYGAMMTATRSSE